MKTTETEKRDATTWWYIYAEVREMKTGFHSSRLAQNAHGVVQGVIKGVTRASFGRRAPLAPQLKRASVIRREEEEFRGVSKMQQVAAEHLGWGQAPSLETENDTRVHSMGAT